MGKPRLGRFAAPFAVMAALVCTALVSAAPAPALYDTTKPAVVQKLVFVHHSTGQAWLEDDYGNLGRGLRDNRYFVSDTNYGWGPASIGDSTDVGHWWTWFRSPSASTNMAALFAESDQHSSYSRLATDPGGSNSIVMIKSCFPNSDVGGSSADTIPAIDANPLKGSSGPLTVGNAKGIYLDLLEYFRTKPDTMFVLITSPPLRSSDTNASNAANARYLANWLVDPNGWLKDYTVGNVVAYDYYTVLTGGHHRVVGGLVEHTAGSSNYLAYPTGDSHPSAAGDRIATAEYLPFLNAAYRSWKAGTGANLSPTRARTATLGAPSAGRTTLSHTTSYRWRGTVAPTQLGTSTVRLYVQHKSDGRWKSWGTRTITLAGGASTWTAWQKLSHAGAYRLRTYHSDADHRAAYSAFRYIQVR